jgi:hypothetical protein
LILFSDCLETLLPLAEQEKLLILIVSSKKLLMVPFPL